MYPDVPWRLIRSLSRKKERDRTGLTVAEGPSVVLAAVEAGVELQALVFAEESADSEKAHTVRQAMDEHDCSCQVFVVPGRLYHKMSGTRTPQGVLGLLRFPFRFARGRPDNTWAQDLDIVGVDIQDPGNVGTLVRTGACAGATSVILCGQSADPFSPKQSGRQQVRFSAPVYSMKKTVSPCSGRFMIQENSCTRQRLGTG